MEKVVEVTRPHAHAVECCTEVVQPQEVIRQDVLSLHLVLLVNGKVPRAHIHAKFFLIKVVYGILGLITLVCLCSSKGKGFCKTDFFANYKGMLSSLT